MCVKYSVCNLYFGFQFFILEDVKRENAEFNEFVVEGTTFAPVGDV